VSNAGLTHLHHNAGRRQAVRLRPHCGGAGGAFGSHNRQAPAVERLRAQAAEAPDVFRVGRSHRSQVGGAADAEAHRNHRVRHQLAGLVEHLECHVGKVVPIPPDRGAIRYQPQFRRLAGGLEGELRDLSAVREGYGLQFAGGILDIELGFQFRLRGHRLGADFLAVQQQADLVARGVYADLQCLAFVAGPGPTAQLIGPAPGADGFRASFRNRPLDGDLDLADPPDHTAVEPLGFGLADRCHRSSN